MNKLKHLQITANSKIDFMQSTKSIDHILSKDSLQTIIIDNFPILKSIDCIGFSPNL